MGGVCGGSVQNKTKELYKNQQPAVGSSTRPEL